MKVLCVPDYAFEYELIREHINGMGLYLDRDVLESNFAYRQIIPYVVLRDSEGKILTYQLQNTSNEERLCGQYTIGIGGHVEEKDGTGWMAVHKASEREIREEIGVIPLLMDGKITIIRLHETEVDRAHLGIGMVLKKWAGKIIPSKEVPSWEWKTIEELKAMELETWARYMLEYRLGYEENKER
jgi:predicted NUDIX family phosphoesterase